MSEKRKRKTQSACYAWVVKKWSGGGGGKVRKEERGERGQNETIRLRSYANPAK